MFNLVNGLSLFVVLVVTTQLASLVKRNYCESGSCRRRQPVGVRVARTAEPLTTVDIIATPLAFLNCGPASLSPVRKSRSNHQTNDGNVDARGPDEYTVIGAVVNLASELGRPPNSSEPGSSYPQRFQRSARRRVQTADDKYGGSGGRTTGSASDRFAHPGQIKRS